MAAGNNRLASPWKVALLSTLALAWAVPACSTDARYRFLSLFLDGVPEPGTQPQVGYAVTAQPLPAADSKPAGRSGPRVVYYSHQPYTASRCGVCHNADDGQLFKSPREGLCSTCHGELLDEPRDLHAPAAVADCLFCHHYHGSSIPGMLLQQPTELCLRCHATTGLTPGPHHTTMDARSCIACHDPHGGDDRMFLERTEP